MFTGLPQGHIGSPPCPLPMSTFSLDCLSIPQDIPLGHHIDDMVLMAVSEKQQRLWTFGKTFVYRGWVIDLPRFQEFSTSVNFLGVQWCGGVWRYLF